MKLRIVSLTLLLAVGALSSLADESSAWRTDPQHPDLQYRVKCHREAATIEWRNGYPGTLALRATIKSNTLKDSYDSAEDVSVTPGGVTDTSLETMSCAPGAFQIRLTHFEMAPPPPKPAPRPVAAAVKAPNPVPTVAPYVPPVRGPEVSPQAIAEVKPGMQQEEVERRLGPPASKLTIPDDGQFIETCRYMVADGRSSLIRFSNGVVTDIITR